MYKQQKNAWKLKICNFRVRINSLSEILWFCGGNSFPVDKTRSKINNLIKNVRLKSKGLLKWT